VLERTGGRDDLTEPRRLLERSSTDASPMAPRISTPLAAGSSRSSSAWASRWPTCVEVEVPLVGLDAVPRDEDGLRRGAHLAAVERQAEGEVGEHRPGVRVPSSTMVLTPAFSVKTAAWVALASSQSPKVVEPVKSTSATSGWVASSMASGRSGSSAARVTRCGEKPASARTSCATSTTSPSGSTAAGWGLTTTAFPVASDANIPGSPFHVGKVRQPMVTSTPRGTTWKRFSITVGRLPGFSQVTSAACRVIASQA
jgi:hypothetical protein